MGERSVFYLWNKFLLYSCKTAKKCDYFFRYKGITGFLGISDPAVGPLVIAADSWHADALLINGNVSEGASTGFTVSEFNHLWQLVIETTILKTAQNIPKPDIKYLSKVKSFKHSSNVRWKAAEDRNFMINIKGEKLE